MGEVITIHVGGAGCRLGEAFWRSMMELHGLQPDGHRPEGSGAAFEPDEVFFSVTPSGGWRPRALFVGTGDVINTVRGGDLRGLLHPEQLRQQGAIGREVTAARPEGAADRVRRLADACRSPAGFIFTHALGGRTASRFAPALMAQLAADYPGLPILSVLLLPAADHLDRSLVTAPYSAVFSAAAVLEHARLAIPVDNATIHAACRQALGVECPSWDHLNRSVASALCTLTEPLRGEARVSLDALAHALAPEASRPCVAIEEAVAFATGAAGPGADTFNGLSRVLGHFDRLRSSGAYLHALERDGVPAAALDDARVRLGALIPA
jgi:tubulin alpha